MMRISLSCLLGPRRNTSLSSILTNRWCHGTADNSNHSIRHILQKAHELHDQQITVKGWVYRLRRLNKKLAFVRLSDGSCAQELQVLLNTPELVTKLRQGAAVSVTGRVVPSPKPKQPIEIHATDVHVYNLPDEQITSMIGSRSQSSPMQMRHQLAVRAKHASLQALLRVREQVQQAIHAHMQSLHYLCVHMPVLSANDCEGAGELFNVTPANSSLMPPGQDYFGKSVYLTVSAQLHLEAITCGISRAYRLGPAFRAERSVTKSHLAEFQMMEVETAFESSLDSLMDFVESLIRSILGCVKHNCADDLFVLHSEQLSLTANDQHQEATHADTNEQLAKDNVHCFLDNQPYTRLRFGEAVHILKEANHQFQFPMNAESTSLNREHERYLVQHFHNRPVFVTHFPAAHKPFYMKRTPDQNESLCFDLLAPVAGEICGGSLREDDRELLEARLATLGDNTEHLQWYVTLRRAGYAPTAGFGLGFERLLQSALNVDNAKDTVPFPRWYGHCPM